LGARHKGAHAIYHLPDEGIEVIRVITHPEDTPRGWLTAHCRVKGRFADPFDLVVASLVGLSADELFFGLRWNYTSHDYKDAVQAACAINKSNPARIMKKAEAAAAKFVRDHEREIIAVGNYLHRKGHASGLELRVVEPFVRRSHLCCWWYGLDSRSVDARRAGFVPRRGRATHADTVGSLTLPDAAPPAVFWVRRSGLRQRS
jgi:hypothetical protein